MKKKVLIMACACMLVLAGVIGGTVAAPTISANHTGNTTVSINDLEVALTGYIPGTTENETVIAMPGQTLEFSESCFVTNTNGYDAYVRVTIDKQWPGNEATLDGAMIDLNLNKEGWYEMKDTDSEQVILYYKEVLPSGKSTSAFLQSVTFDPSMDNSYTDKEANITITVDAVQAATGEAAMLSEWGVKPVIDANGNITSILE